MALSDKIVALVGPGGIRRGSTLAAIARRRGVQRTVDFRRIESLPRRVWDADPGEIEELRFGLSEMLRPSPPPGQRALFDTSEVLIVLNAIQAAALRDVHDYRGAFLPIPVGGGKALISLLAPVVLEAERPILLVPADLREQTNRKVIPQMSRHFRLHPRLRVIGNSEISLAKNGDLLWRLMPDVIVIDECHAYKNKGSGRTRRLSRFLAEFPATVVVAMSGTVSNRSLKDYQHIVRWCLGDAATPLPIKWPELSDWADALDEGVPDSSRVAPGALSRLCAPGEAARDGYRRRLVETPGVIAGRGGELGTSLRIHALRPQIPDRVSRMLSDLRESWEDPNGDPLVEAIAVWRIARQLALGFWYEWSPTAPPDWLKARKAWKAHVRHTIAHNRRNLDTELQVWNECARDGGPQEWIDWAAIRDSFKPNTVARWVDPFVVDAVADWIKAGPGIVWVEHSALGERLSRDLGIPYFGPGKKASAEILDAGGPIVASVRAHGQGKNLQQWYRNLITSPSSSGKVWEQLLGRTHRMGQPEDTVTAHVLQSIPEQVDSLRQAFADARYLEDTLGGRQRLNYADVMFDV